MIRIYLGGTWNESNWRRLLIKLFHDKISYFNPIVDDWDEKAQLNEINEREKCDFCLCTITPKMTRVYSIAEVVDDSNKRPGKTVLVLLKDDVYEHFNRSQWKSLQAVSEMVKRNGGQVFFSLAIVADYFNNMSEKL